MKKNLMAVILLLIVVLAIYLWMKANRTFSWVDNYAHESDEPFDCEIFDSIASATMPNGYSYWHESFDSLMHLPGPKSLLIINKSWSCDSTVFHRLDSCVRAGGKVLLVLKYDMMPLQLAYKIQTSYDYADCDTLAKSLRGQLPHDTLQWVEGDPLSTTVNQGLYGSWFKGGYDEHFKPTAFLRSASIWQMLSETEERMGIHAEEPVESVLDSLEQTVEVDDDAVSDVYDQILNDMSVDRAELWKAHLMNNGMGVPVALAGQVGKGWYYVSSTPWFFTNYGALDTHISKILNRQMAQLADYHTYRLDSKIFVPSWDDYSRSDDFTVSPLSYMLSKPPLRWALFTLLAAVVLFMIFTARRRQRIIPVIPQPTNRNLDFVRLLGTIYFRRHDNIDLLRKKYTYFKDDVRRRLMMDLDDETNERQIVRTLAQRASIDEDEVAELLSSLRGITSLTGGDISAQDLMNYVNRIENISKHL